MIPRQILSTEGGATEARENGVDPQDLLEVLTNDRRRAVIGLLRERGDSMSVRELATAIAAAEADKPSESISYKERKRVQSGLAQFHLPKMAELGVVTYDRRAGTVGLTESLRGFDPTVELRTHRRLPWSTLAMGVVGANGLCLLLVVLGQFSLTVTHALLWVGLLTALFAMTLLGQLYDERVRGGRSLLGSGRLLDTDRRTARRRPTRTQSNGDGPERSGDDGLS